MSSHIFKLLSVEKLFIRREVIRASHACKSSLLQTVRTSWVTYGIIRDSFDFVYLIFIYKFRNIFAGHIVQINRFEAELQLRDNPFVYLCTTESQIWLQFWVTLCERIWNTKPTFAFCFSSFLPHLFPFFFLFSFREHVTICCQSSIRFVYVYLASYLSFAFSTFFPTDSMASSYQTVTILPQVQTNSSPHQF
jgi:hypothetical protein